MPEHVYIAIEGPIGVGKTTLVRMLQPEFHADSLLEIFEENPFLSDFYADRERFAFQTQIFFLLSRYRQQREAQAIAMRRSLISDYIFAKDRLFARLNLRGDELEMYERLHSALAERVRVPDLVLYLRASPDVLMERIATRDRPYERAMSRTYIEDLVRAYEQFFTHYSDTRLLILDTDNLNVVGNPTDLHRVAASVRAALADSGSVAAPPWLAEARPAPSAAAVEAGLQAGSNATPAVIELYLEFLDLQKAVGELAHALRQAWPRGPIASAQSAAWGIDAAAIRRELPALHEALAACEESLQRIAQRASA